MTTGKVTILTKKYKYIYIYIDKHEKKLIEINSEDLFYKLYKVKLYSKIYSIFNEWSTKCMGSMMFGN